MYHVSFPSLCLRKIKKYIYKKKNLPTLDSFLTNLQMFFFFFFNKPSNFFFFFFFFFFNKPSNFFFFFFLKKKFTYIRFIFNKPSNVAIVFLNMQGTKSNFLYIILIQTFLIFHLCL
jgi:hypothetical protein